MTDTDEIKSRLPIDQVIAGYLPLKKSGRIFKARCPFHVEKTASFTVSPDRGIFKCFGCGEGGDIFDFVMKIEGITFPEAKELLAEKAGITLEKWQPPFKASTSSQSTNSHNPPADPNAISKTRLFQLNAYTAKLWHTILTKHPKAEAARAYLQERGIKPETIDHFQIGWAPPGQVTSISLEKAGFNSAEWRLAGDPGKFQDRITFPITDITGRVVGFTGRIFANKEESKTIQNGPELGPKYWNTPETPVFRKSQTLYGLNFAKNSIQKEDKVILVEGQMDVIMLHQSGQENAVASSGTSLTPEQIRLISRFSDNIFFAYDKDRAGIEASKRGIGLVLENGLNPFVIDIPTGKDPAECLQTNPEGWFEAYQKGQPFMAWLLETILKNQISSSNNPDLDPIKKKKLVKEILPWLARIEDPTEREEWLKISAARLQTEESNLKLALKILPKPYNTSNPPTPSISPPTTAQNPNHPLLKKAELAAAFLFNYPENIAKLSTQLNILESFHSDFLDQIVPNLSHLEQIPSEKEKKLKIYSEELFRPYEEIELTSQIALEETAIILQNLRSESKDRLKAELARQIKQAQTLGESERVKQLFSDLQNMI